MGGRASLPGCQPACLPGHQPALPGSPLMLMASLACLSCVVASRARPPGIQPGSSRVSRQPGSQPCVSARRSPDYLLASTPAAPPCLPALPADITQPAHTALAAGCEGVAAM